MKPLSIHHLLLGVLVVLLAACDKPAPPPPQTPPPPEVTVAIAHAESVPLMRELVGRLAATRVAQVRARVAGTILKRVYTEGTDVKRGQVLFQIDPALLKANLHATEAALAKAQADAANATLIAKRYRDLAAKQLLSSQDLDTALANERSTAAGVKVAQANLEKTQLDLSYAMVTAPIDGRAGRALVTEGALVGQDEATQLTTIEQIDPIYVNFSQSVTELQLLQQLASAAPAGAKEQRNRGSSGTDNSSLENSSHENTVEIMLPDGTPYPHPGNLDFSDLAVDPGTGVVSLRASVPNPAHRLLPGMFVSLRVPMGKLDHAFLLPQASILRDSAGAYILVVDATGKVEQRRVQTHGMTLTAWIVTGSVADGDQVIVDGLQKVKPGQMAKAVSAATDNNTPSAGTSATKP